MDGECIKCTAMQINHRQIEYEIKISFCHWALASHYDEVMVVHSSVIIRIPVRSHNQGPLINHSSWDSNYLLLE